MSGTMTFWICNSLVLDGDKVLPIPGSYVGWPEKALEAINKCEIACIEFWRSHYSGDVIGAIWATLEGELHTWIDEYCVFDAFATSSMITKNALYICKGPKQVHKHVMTGDYQQVFDDYGITYDGRIIDFCPSKEGRIQEHERQFERLESVLWIGDGFCV